MLTERTLDDIKRYPTLGLGEYGWDLDGDVIVSLIEQAVAEYVDRMTKKLRTDLPNVVQPQGIGGPFTYMLAGEDVWPEARGLQLRGLRMRTIERLVGEASLGYAEWCVLKEIVLSGRRRAAPGEEDALFSLYQRGYLNYFGREEGWDWTADGMAFVARILFLNQDTTPDVLARLQAYINGYER